MVLLLFFSCSVMSSSLQPMGYSTPGFPVLHYLLEFAQTHVHWVSDATQPAHPLSPPSPAFNLSQHQGLFQWVSSLHQVAKLLELQLQHQSFQWIFRVDWFVPLAVQRISKVFSNSTVQKHQFFWFDAQDAQPCLWFNSSIHTWLLEKYSFEYMDLCQRSDISAF